MKMELELENFDRISDILETMADLWPDLTRLEARVVAYKLTQFANRQTEEHYLPTDSHN